MKFEVRAVAQNALNRPNFYGPDATIAPSSYTDASLTTLKTPNSIAQVSCVNDGGRHVQLYCKFTF